MPQAVIDNILTGGYLLVWLITLIWYQRKNRAYDGGSAIIISYIIYAVFSLLSLNDDIFSSWYEPLHFFPYLYLYLMLMIALSPAIYNHIYPGEKLEEPHTRILFAISIIYIGCALILLPNIIVNFQEGFVRLLTDSDAGKDAYSEQLSEAGEQGSAITNIPAILFNMLSDIGIFLCFYYMSRKEKKPVLIILLLLAMFIGLLIPVMRGQRSGVFLSGITIILGYMLFKRYLSNFINRIVLIIGIVGVIIISLPVVAITFSRFGESKGQAAVTGFISWYIGQGNLYFNNYGLDAGGIRYGDRTINLVKRAIDPDTPKNFVERRELYHNLEIDDYYFTTFVGDFTLDFGPVIAVLIFVVFNLWVLTQIQPRDGTLTVAQLLLLYFTMCICMQGGMYLFAYSDTANLKILAVLLLYAYLKYHDVLLRKFPLYSNQHITI
jgi:oligosaccharide repeat unit polymerase